MAVIVGVHGIGQQVTGAKALQRQWFPALNDGLRRSGAAALKGSDFVCAFYGDLLRRKSGKFRRKRGKKIRECPYEAPIIIDDSEQELLEAWSHEVEILDAIMPAPNPEGMGGTPYGVQRCLKVLCRSKFFVGMAERAMIASLRQVSLYFQNSHFRSEICGRIEAVITPETRVIVAHSLGSVVAYECLCAHPEWPVHTFITLGSPLGIRNLIFDRLCPAPTGGKGVWPGSVRRWVNVADRGDVIALVKDLRSRFGACVEDRLVNNGATVHAATAYLTAEETGQAIAVALAV